MQEYAVHMLRTLDANGDGFISFDELKHGLQACEIYLTDHEMHTLVRTFDHNND